MVRCIVLILIVTSALLVAGAAHGMIMYFLHFDGRSELLKYQAKYVWLVTHNLTRNDTVLQYYIAVNGTVENPNRKCAYVINQADGVLYSAINQTNNLMLQRTNETYFSNDFMVGPKKVKLFNSWFFKGETQVALGADEVSKFKNSTTFDLIFRLYVNCYTRIGARRRHYMHLVSCYLKVPFLSSIHSIAQNFNATGCDLDQIIKIK
ncbi:hypothetical protein CerSpe_228440 [Prunus speciosa]